MARIVGIGQQNFEVIRENNYFYVDKTAFIREWWERGDNVSLIVRPRRFGKTLNMSMLECFFSVKYADRGDLFEGLSIWENEKFRKIQGSWPVISLSFANVKENSYEKTRYRINQILMKLYGENRFLLEGNLLTQGEKDYYERISENMREEDATMSLHNLSDFLSRYYKKKVILLLDEYDTPMQEAYVNGYWPEMVSFTRSLFHAAFKTNPYLERAVMTGITRVSRESVFSDLNNLKVVTTISEEYEDCFGFVEEEVFAALKEFGRFDKKEEVKRWYDGFTFGKRPDIYNPWSIINYLDCGRLKCYWANTSSNSLVGTLLRESSKDVKQDFEKLLSGEHLLVRIEEQLVYDQLEGDETAIWSFLLASGYLRVYGYRGYEVEDWGVSEPQYELGLTNLEVELMFRSMVTGWFRKDWSGYNGFIKALLLDDVEAMNEYINEVTQSVFSYFDTGKNPLREEPERFYHGFVLGLMAELKGRYVLTSNRESGYGRYDVMLEPVGNEDDAIILEFKVFKPKKENELSDTVAAALKQIEEKQYEAMLTAKGIPKERIRKYGFAFRGKEVLVG